MAQAAGHQAQLEELEELPITREVLPVGAVIAVYAAVVTAVFVIAVTQGLLRLGPLLGVVAVLVVNIGAVLGLIPAMGVWRRTPVARWLVWGSWAGALAGWATVVVLAAFGLLVP